MRTWNIVIVAGLACAVVAPGSGNAQTPTPSPALLATLEARHASGVHGTVSVTPQGAGSMVHVTFAQLPQPLLAGNEALTLMIGADCTDLAPRAATVIPLSTVNGNTSKTLVSIPFSAFTSGHFIVDVRNATSRAEMAEACAHI